jgi:hypothetical protein
MWEYTCEGYLEAEKYLKDTNQWYLVEKELSTDGYTIIALANSLKERHESKTNIPR